MYLSMHQNLEFMSIGAVEVLRMIIFESSDYL
jgi:hypothetical protein